MTNEQIQKILVIILCAMASILLILVIALFFLSLKSKIRRKKINNNSDQEEEEATVVSKYAQYKKKSIQKFMEFEKIEDNMIIIKSGFKYVMVAECQGVNYDLMSQNEKNAVEAGFVQFLNTLRHSVQIYTQTRTVNLENSIFLYKERMKAVEEKLGKMRAEYDRMIKSNRYSKEELEKYFFEITKQNNLYEYGKDVIFNTEKMSLNRNVLNKKYYIIVPCYPAELGINNLDKEEIQSRVFSDLYTKTQSLVRALATCGITGRILNSNELVELLYMAYNRDEAEVFGLDKIIRSGYDELYTTAQDVMDKKIKELDRQIEITAMERANQKILEAKSEKELFYEEKKRMFNDVVDEKAKKIVKENRFVVGKDITDRALEKIDKDKIRRKRRSEVGVSDEIKAKRRIKRTN